MAATGRIHAGLGGAKKSFWKLIVHDDIIREGSNEAWLVNWRRLPKGFVDNPLEGVLRCTLCFSKNAVVSKKKEDHIQLTDFLKEIPLIWDI